MSEKREIFVELFETEQKNLKKTESLFGKEIQNYRMCLELLRDAVANINDNNKAIRLRDFCVFQFCFRTISSSKNLLDLIVRGYYWDAMIIERGLLENSCLILYLLENETNIDKWMHGKTKLRDIRKELNLFSNKGFIMGYAYLSDFVHNNLGAIRHLVTAKSATEMSAQIEPKLIENYFEGWFLFYPKHAQLCLEVILKNYSENIDYELGTRIIKFLKKLDKDGDEFFDIHREVMPHKYKKKNLSE